jgi:uncharacterized protein (TIGR02599 family)
MPGPARRGKHGFTIVELMVSMGILTLLLLVLVSITSATQRTWTYTTNEVEQFHDAREAFESVTRKLSQATLNTYWDYVYASGTAGSPTGYMRQSELRFISGQASSLMPVMKDANGNTLGTTTHAVFFQAPLGYTLNTQAYSNLKNLLNTWGYFIEFGSDQPSWPKFLQGMKSPPAPRPRYRFRLMELSEPSDALTLYNYTSGTNSSGGPKNASYITTTPLAGLSYPSVTPAPTGTGFEWFTTPLTASSPPARVLAENIVALVLLPKLSPGDIAALNQAGGTYSDGSLAPDYNYDSTASNSNPAIDPRNQLPPVVQVTMVAVDESSYNRFQILQSGASMPTSLGQQSLFQTVGDTLNPGNPGFAQDLQTFENNLQKFKINYRVFTSNVDLKAAKWSRDEAN